MDERHRTDAVDRPRGPRRGVTVTGTGVAVGVPDVVVAELGAEAVADDVQQALDAATAGLAALRGSLVAGGVPDEDVRTAQTSTWTDRSGGPEAPLRTTARLTLRAVLRDTASAGALVRDALAAAGPVARLDALGLALSDPGALAVEARAAAFADARARAEQYARLAGRDLGDVLDVREDAGVAVPIARAFAAKGAASSAPLTVDPGQQEVRASVTVRWAFAD